MILPSASFFASPSTIKDSPLCIFSSLVTFVMTVLSLSGQVLVSVVRISSVVIESFSSFQN
jgi:hypothetical protein